MFSHGPPQFSGAPHTSCVGFRYFPQFTALIAVEDIDFGALPLWVQYVSLPRSKSHSTLNS